MTGAPVHMLDEAIRYYYGRDKGGVRFLDDTSRMIVCLVLRFKDSSFKTFSTGLNLLSRGRDLFLEVDDCKDRKLINIYKISVG